MGPRRQRQHTRRVSWRWLLILLHFVHPSLNSRNHCLHQRFRFWVQRRFFLQLRDRLVGSALLEQEIPVVGMDTWPHLPVARLSFIDRGEQHRRSLCFAIRSGMLLTGIETVLIGTPVELFGGK